jgi:para-nitrobenzyl esterase
MNSQLNHRLWKGLRWSITLLAAVYSQLTPLGAALSQLGVVVSAARSGAFDICLMMASPLARGLFQRAIMESGNCQSTLIADIRTPIHLNGITGAGEDDGERPAADLGIAPGPRAIDKLRALPAETTLKVWSRDQQIQFDAIVDGWVLRDQPARIFAPGRQAHIPVLVGSNGDDATVFGPGPTTISDYWKYLRADTGPYAEQEFRL